MVYVVEFVKNGKMKGEQKKGGGVFVAYGISKH